MTSVFVHVDHRGLEPVPETALDKVVTAMRDLRDDGGYSLNRLVHHWRLRTLSVKEIVALLPDATSRLIEETCVDIGPANCRDRFGSLWA